MKKRMIFLAAMFFLISQSYPQNFEKLERCNAFDKNWRFHLGDIKGAENPAFDDSNWRVLNLPHDYSIEGSFDSTYASATGYLPGGIGWYRKEFRLSPDDKNYNYYLQFDGVYERSEVWLNGRFLGRRPYGFISFYYDLTPYLNFGDKKNVIAVRVDNSDVADSRWYTGSGIFRHVWLYKKNRIHVANWGAFVTSHFVNKKRANVRAVTEVENNTNDDKLVKLQSIIIDSEGNVVGQTESEIIIPAGAKHEYDASINIKNPRLWSIEEPYLYRLVNKVYDGKLLADNDTVNFGVRTIRFDANEGFFLNDKPVTIKGVCLHNDAGPLGSAVPVREWESRLELMKEMGANAIRTSHNPPPPELLDLCDRMGFLVMDEAFDEWKIGKKKWIKGWNVGQEAGASGLNKYYSQNGYGDYFEEWAKRDLQDMVRRDRNHPSVILWSIGNEIDYPNDPYTDPTRDNYEPWRPPAFELTEIAKRLYDYIKEIDTTRPVTAALANIPLSNEIGYAQILDVVGYNYQEQYYQRDHARFPERKIIGSENGDSYSAWLAVKNNPFVSGQFLWTGIDYLGEAGKFPSRSNTSGLIDLCDFKKPGFYYRKSLWTDEPMVFVSVTPPYDTLNRFRFNTVESWNWDNYKEKELQVVAFTNCDSVRLLLNNRMISTKKLSDAEDAMIFWKVKYESGELTALAYRNGKVVAKHIIKTASEPESIILKSDRSSIEADGKDIARIEIIVVDKNGNRVPYADNIVETEVVGEGINIGFGNGDSKNLESFKSNAHSVYRGRARLFVQSNGNKGKIIVRAKSKNLKPGEIIINAN
ncbi:glycoside hydrolase family 2 sugar binding protein [Melioribacter roseus P3M-2]|uniref:Glycoside hydrolase family 2 sugar binding protein n=1 Tax=Melioribacter roseus (strain DSM 23840 / JCM 17771 / VKM B-2668 / P3M-2) TaxID=1191523 RepID=I6ZQ73_MELRP|nr:glycoside hydrolase family 2 TIM barrel-domain containing protein [Melioribacter roseus]AFN74219.1 glycoside hydrolase family 2 sugar binding protein [Melioribacter roseus P3M-2]